MNSRAAPLAVALNAGKVRLAVQFGKYTDVTSPYMYHCQILRHEDKGMMGQFVVVEPGTEGGVLRCPALPPRDRLPGERGDHHT